MSGKFKGIGLIVLFAVLALLASSCVAVPLFEIDIITVNVSSTGALQSFVVTFRAAFDKGESYLWDFGDGSQGTGQIIVHTYTSAGKYTVRLEILSESNTFVATKIIELNANTGAPTGPVFPARAFVYNNNDTLDVVDLDSKQILATIPVDEVDWFVFESMARFAVSPDGTKAYVVHPNDNKLSVIDLVNYVNPLIDIAVGNWPNSVAFNPSGTRAYVTNRAEDTVSVIDVMTDTVIDTISVGNDPRLIIVHPNGIRAYVVNHDDDDISILNLTNNTNLNNDISYGPASSPQFTSLDISPDGTKLYASLYTGSPQGVAVIDLVSESLITTIPITLPVQVVIRTDGTRGYVTQPGQSDDITVLDLTNNTIDSTITGEAGEIKVGLATSSDGTLLYVLEINDAEIGIIDLTSNTDTNIDIPLGGVDPLIIIVQD